MRQVQSWTRRGHAVDCWQYHERCALLSARDLMETRAAHVKAQASMFRSALDRLDQLSAVTPEPELLEVARRILREYHALLRSGKER